MMKKIAFLAFLCTLSLTLHAQSVFNRLYLNDSLVNNYGTSRDVIQTSDGGYLVAGANSYRNKIAAIKLNAQGDTIWSFSKQIGSGYEMAHKCLETSDHNYVLVGYYYDTINGNDEEGFLIKLNFENGEIIWFHQFGIDNRFDEIFSAIETPDNGIAICGSKAIVSGSGSQTTVSGVDVLLIKADSLGIFEWEETYGGIEAEDAKSIEITDEGGFIMLGVTYSFGLGLTSMYVVKTDNLGNMIWQKSYGGSFADEGWAMHKLNDGNYVIVGQSNYASDSTGAYIAKIDPDGIIIWEKNFKGAKQFQDFEDVKQLPNGNIVACGINQLTSSGSRYQGILKALNPTDGSVVWEKQYKYNVVDSTINGFYGLDICSDGGIVISGLIWDLHTYTHLPVAMWVVKTDCKGNATAWSNTCSQAGIEEFNDEVSPTWFTLYPNPTTSNFSVQCTLPENSKKNTISIYDAMGKLMQIVPISAFSNVAVEIDASGFAKGVYSIVLSSDKQILQTQKLVRME